MGKSFDLGIFKNNIDDPKVNDYKNAAKKKLDVENTIKRELIVKEYLKEHIPDIYREQIVINETIIYDFMNKENDLDTLDKLQKKMKNREFAISVLKKANVKFSENDFIFATFTSQGNLCFFEKGNHISGLTHIMYGMNNNGHLEDFNRAFNKKFNKKTVIDFIRIFLEKGKIVSKKLNLNKRIGWDILYSLDEYPNYNLCVGMGTNGFINTVFPRKKRRKLL